MTTPNITANDLLVTAMVSIRPNMAHCGVPPEVLMAAVRLMFVIDQGDVAIGVEGEGMALYYGEAMLALLSEKVPGESVTVLIFESGQGLTVERTITREPIDSPVAMIRQRISKLAKARSVVGG